MADLKLSIPILFDTRELELAAVQLSQANNKSLAYYFNKKMAWFLRRALWKIKSAEPVQIAHSLGVRLRYGKPGTKSAMVRGVRRTLKFKGGWKMVHGRLFGNVMSRRIEDKGGMVPLAVLIMAKRIREGLPGGGGLTQSPFKGVPRKEGQRAMKRLITRMTKARARSTGYMKSGPATALKSFPGYASNEGASPGVPPLPAGVNLRPVGRPKAFGYRATPQNTVATFIDATFQKKFQKDGLNNDALQRIVIPAMQEAYDEELAYTREQLEHVLLEAAKKVGVTARR